MMDWVRDPAPGDFVVFTHDVIEAVSFLQDRVVADVGRIGVVHRVQRAFLMAPRVRVVLIGSGRVVTARVEQLRVLDVVEPVP